MMYFHYFGVKFDPSFVRHLASEANQLAQSCLLRPRLRYPFRVWCPLIALAGNCNNLCSCRPCHDISASVFRGPKGKPRQTVCVGSLAFEKCVVDVHVTFSDAICNLILFPREHPIPIPTPIPIPCSVCQVAVSVCCLSSRIKLIPSTGSSSSRQQV